MQRLSVVLLMRLHFEDVCRLIAASARNRCRHQPLSCPAVAVTVAALAVVAAVVVLTVAALAVVAAVAVLTVAAVVVLTVAAVVVVGLVHVQWQ